MNKQRIDLSLYCVLDANFCKTPEGMADTALAAVRGGATVIQLRAPEWKKRRQLEAALLLKEALSGTEVPLIINDHVDIALLSNAEGVHVGQEDLPADQVRALLGPDKIIGLSVGSLADLDRVSDSVNYIGVGPVFSTATKKDAKSAIGCKTLQAIVSSTHLPSVAIGGIQLNNLTEVLQTDVSGIAVVSAICAQKNPEKAAQRLRESISRNRLHQ